MGSRKEMRTSILYDHNFDFNLHFSVIYRLLLASVGEFQ